MDLLGILKCKTFNQRESDWNRDINVSIVLFEAFATTGGWNDDTCT